jgi:CO dehydrogenase nickel-insertion accessory protein CooC1
LGIGNIAIVLNKSTSPAEDLEWIKSEFGENSVLGVIPFDSRIAAADRKGCALIDMGDDEMLNPFRAIYDKINAQYKS